MLVRFSTNSQCISFPGQLKGIVVNSLRFFNQFIQSAGRIACMGEFYACQLVCLS